MVDKLRVFFEDGCEGEMSIQAIKHVKPDNAFRVEVLKCQTEDNVQLDFTYNQYKALSSLWFIDNVLKTFIEYYTKFKWHPDNKVSTADEFRYIVKKCTIGAGESKYKTFRVKGVDVVDPVDTLNNIGSKKPPHHGGYDGHPGFDSQFGLGGGYFHGPGYYRQQPHQGYSNWPQLQAITQPRPRRAQARSFQPSAQQPEAREPVAE
ncbi:hypothetical protein Tco_1086615 [Tanacetum coccineum]